MNKNIKSHIILISFFFLFLGAEASVLKVPTDYSTIQLAIDSSMNGDTVLILDGIYTGVGNRDVSFNGKLIVVRSKNGPRSTIIDCDGSITDEHRGFVFENGETSSSVLEGITIRNGYKTPTGGAIKINSAHPNINDCIFLNNYSLFGGAISIVRSNTNITNSIFKNNTTFSNYDVSIYCSDNSRPHIQNCSIFGDGNIQVGSEYNSNITFKNSLLINGVIYSWNGDPYSGDLHGASTIENNVFFNASVSASPDGGYVFDNDSSIYSDPLICDSSSYLYKIDPTSPCLPENNQFGVLIGASDSVCISTEIIEYQNELPSDFSLSQNYPNPFNPTTNIEFNIPYNTHVKIEIINLLGQTVRTLINQKVNAGKHIIEWDGIDQMGNRVTSGVYFYSIDSEYYSNTKKMLFLK